MSDAQIDHDYKVSATVSKQVFDQVTGDYVRRADEVVAGLAGHRDIVYDEASGRQLDVWGVTEDYLRPVFVSIHGGYWRAGSRRHASFMAGVLDQQGIATVAVDYDLAPDVALAEIVRQVRASVAWIHAHGSDHGLDPDRIVVGGSSAGGHLAAAVMIPGWQERFGLPANAIRAGVPISGLFDLRPLVDSFANEWLGLDRATAANLSPMLHTEDAAVPALIAVAERDGVGFLAQSREFHERWSRCAPAELLVVPDRHHYDVFLDLADPDSELTRRVVALVHSLDPCAELSDPRTTNEA